MSLVPPWQVIRWKVLERDGFKCTKCGSAKDLEAHHIIPRRKGGADDLDNLTTLCKKCHDIADAHLKRQESEARGIIGTRGLSKAERQFIMALANGDISGYSQNYKRLLKHKIRQKRTVIQNTLDRVNELWDKLEEV